MEKVEQIEMKKLGEIPDEELQITQSINDGFEISVKDLERAGFYKKEFMGDTGAYTKWIMRIDSQEWAVPQGVMASFRTAITENAKSVKVKKSGEGMKTRYECIIKG